MKEIYKNMKKTITWILLLLPQLLLSTDFVLEKIQNDIYLTELNIEKECRFLKLYKVQYYENAKSILTSEKDCIKSENLSRSIVNKFLDEKSKFFKPETISKDLQTLSFPFTVYKDKTKKNTQFSLDIVAMDSPFKREILFFLTVNGKKVQFLSKEKYETTLENSKYEKFYTITKNGRYHLFIKYGDVLHSTILNEQDFFNELKPYTFNFYTQGALMWLVDSTYKFMGKNYFSKKEIDLSAQLELLASFGSFDGPEDEQDEDTKAYRQAYKKMKNKKSAYFFVKQINSTDLYKYKNWRIPTKDELMSLDEKKSSFFTKRTRDYYTKLSIDVDSFHDFNKHEYKEKYFLSSDRCNSDDNDKKYFAVYYGLYRQKVYKCRGTHTCDRVDLDNKYGAKLECISPQNKKVALRLVRDIK